MPVLLAIGLALDVAGVVSLMLAYGDVLDAGWAAIAVGVVPAIGSASSMVGVGLASQRRVPLVAFAVSGIAWLFAAAQFWFQRLDAPIVAIALVAQVVGWCCLVATGQPRRRWRQLTAFVVIVLALALHVAMPVAAVMDGFGRAVAEAVLTSDVETPEELAELRASVRADGVAEATPRAIQAAAVGTIAIGLLLLLWYGPGRRRDDGPE